MMMQSCLMVQVQHLDLNLDSAGDLILMQFVMDQRNIVSLLIKEKIHMHMKIVKLSNHKPFLR